MIKRFVVVFVLLVILCGGLIGFNLFRTKMIGDFFANQQMPAVTVSATEVRPIRWSPEIETIGTLVAAQGVDVATQTAGIVDAIEFTANENVEQGQLLVQLVDAVERADVASAEATMVQDSTQLERARRLTDRGVNSEATLEEAETALAVSASALERIRAVIEQKSIEAPFAGTIGIPRVDVGEYIQPGAVIATLQQLDTMQVDLTVPEQQLGAIRIGQPAAFALESGDFRYEGKLIGIDPKVDPETRMVSVRAEVSNPGGELLPGQFARVRLSLPAEENVLTLPQTAVVTSLYGDYAYVVEPAEATPATAPEDTATAPEADGATESATPDPEASAAAPDQLVARQAFVTVGRRQGSLIEIVEGIEAGQTVVTSGQNKLANGAPVIINNSVDPAALAFDESRGQL